MAHRYLPLPVFHRLDWQPYGLRTKTRRKEKRLVHPKGGYVKAFKVLFSLRSLGSFAAELLLFGLIARILQTHRSSAASTDRLASAVSLPLKPLRAFRPAPPICRAREPGP